MAVNIRNPILNEAYNHLKTIELLASKAFADIQRDRSYIDKIVSSEIHGIYSKSRDKSHDYINKVSIVARENALVYLGLFEKILFDRLDNSMGSLRTLVKEKSPKDLYYYQSREDFVKTTKDINKLSDIVKLIGGKIPRELLDDIKIIKEYRDFICHGSNDKIGKKPIKFMTLEEIVETLDSTLSSIPTHNELTV